MPYKRKYLLVLDAISKHPMQKKIFTTLEHMTWLHHVTLYASLNKYNFLIQDIITEQHAQVSNQTLHPATTGGHLRIVKLCGKQMHTSKLFSHEPFLKSIHKTNLHKHKTKHETQIFKELVQSCYPYLLKERIRLGHAGIVDHSNLLILEKIYKRNE